MIFRWLKSHALKEPIGADDTHRLDDVLFGRFFKGDFAGTLELYRSREPQAWSAKSTHYAFAAAVNLSEPTEDIRQQLPEPINRPRFDLVIREQLREESLAATRGLLRQPKHLIKTFFVAAIGLTHNRRFFVETGTYTGQSILSVSRLFERLWTVEASPLLFAASQRLFAETNAQNVQGRLGDSKDLLVSLPQEFLNRAVVFLDAHYSTGITSRAFGECPVIDEISIVLERAENALIVVDDLRTMTGKNGYPTLTQVLNSIPSWASAEIAFDQLIIGGPSTRDPLTSGPH